MSTPNILTLFRLSTAPLFLILFIGSGKGEFLSSFLTPSQGILGCIIIIIISELSDVLDGIIARRLNQVTNFGKILDPYADSIFRLSIFFSFASQTHGKWIPIWMAMIILYRDLLVTVIRSFGIERREFVQARASGKIKAVAQATAAVSIMVVAYIKGDAWVSYASDSGETVTSLAYYLMCFAVTITLWSAVDYFWGNKHLFKNAVSTKKESNASKK